MQCILKSANKLSLEESMKNFENYIVIVLILISVGLLFIKENYSIPFFFVTGIYSIYLLNKRGLLKK